MKRAFETGKQRQTAGRDGTEKGNRKDKGGRESYENDEDRKDDDD